VVYQLNSEEPVSILLIVQEEIRQQGFQKVSHGGYIGLWSTFEFLLDHRANVCDKFH